MVNVQADKVYFSCSNFLLSSKTFENNPLKILLTVSVNISLPSHDSYSQIWHLQTHVVSLVSLCFRIAENLLSLIMSMSHITVQQTLTQIMSDIAA